MLPSDSRTPSVKRMSQQWRSRRTLLLFLLHVPTTVGTQFFGFIDFHVSTNRHLRLLCRGIRRTTFGFRHLHRRNPFGKINCLGISLIIPQHIDICNRQHYMLCFQLDKSVIEVYNQDVLWAGLNIPPPKYLIALASKSGSSLNFPKPVLQLSQRKPLNSPVP